MLHSGMVNGIHMEWADACVDTYAVPQLCQPPVYRTHLRHRAACPGRGATVRTYRVPRTVAPQADTAVTAEEREQPAVLFLHGWPESWYSWRFQLAAVKAAGYRGVAPSMRGYGATEAPDDYASYNAYTLAADALGLLQRLGIGRAALVGHDHGANLGWKLCLLHPRVFTVYAAMSVPYGGRPRAAPLN